MEESSIVFSEDHIESCVMFSGLIANPSTGKSQSLTFFDKGISKIEAYNGTRMEDSKLVKGKNQKTLFLFY